MRMAASAWFSRPLGLSVAIRLRRCWLISSGSCWSNSGGNEASLIVSYLVQNFGLKKQSAIVAARRMNLESLEKYKSVVALLKEQGFSDAQVTRVIRVNPRLLTCKPYKSLLPKIEFFYSKFTTCADVTAILSAYPTLLSSSLSRRLIPSFDYLVGLFQSESHAVTAIRRFGDALLFDPDSYIAQNLETLVRWGVPPLKIIMLFKYHSVSISKCPKQFEQTLEELKRLDFNPKSTAFIKAVMFLEQWAKKADVFREYGCTEEELKYAFRRFPQVAGISCEKIRSVFDFMVGEMIYKPCAIAKFPLILGLSLNKRIIPRSHILKILIENGIRINIASAFGVSADTFRRNYIQRYDSIPGLLQLYEEKLLAANQKS